MQTTLPMDAPVGAYVFDAAALFRRLLVPIDFSDGSKRAIATALELQRRFGSEVCLFHLTESSENDQFIAGLGEATTSNDLVDEAQGRIRRFLDNVFPGQAQNVVIRTRIGSDIVQGIDGASADCKSTLVLLGCRPKQTLFRSPVEKIVHELTCPVMLVRECGETAAEPS